MSEAGLGVVCLRHDVPFHASASVSVIPEAFTNEPTATHDVADRQDMDLIWPPGSVTLGECCMVQPGLAASAVPVGIAAEETIAKTAIAFAAIEMNARRHIGSPRSPVHNRASPRRFDANDASSREDCHQIYKYSKIPLLAPWRLMHLEPGQTRLERLSGHCCRLKPASTQGTQPRRARSTGQRPQQWRTGSTLLRALVGVARMAVEPFRRVSALLLEQMPAQEVKFPATAFSCWSRKAA